MLHHQIFNVVCCYSFMAVSNIVLIFYFYATGKKLFPTSTEEVSWTPPSDATSPDHGALTLELESFDVAQAQNGMGNNTCGMFNVIRHLAVVACSSKAY